MPLSGGSLMECTRYRNMTRTIWRKPMKIGFIGLGMMGAGMASNLQKAGHDLVVNDLTRQAASRHLNAGATWADSPRAVAASCDIVFTSLPTPADVQKVGTGDDGLIHGFRRGSAWFDLST